jgi:Meiotically up-regulated gene 113/Arm DNA-binding domain
MGKVLTAAAVEKLKPGPHKRIILDGGAPGLYLVIQPTGTKSWQMRFRRPGGKCGKLTLGRVDLTGRDPTGEPVVGMPLSLRAARVLAAQIHRDRTSGRDVITDYRDAKSRLRRAAREENEDNRILTNVRQFIASDRETAAIDGVSVVYFIVIGSAVKIGTTTRFENRLKALRGASAERMTVLAVLPGGRELEQRLHRAFAAARISNEFFRTDVVTRFLTDLANRAVAIAASDDSPSIAAAIAASDNVVSLPSPAIAGGNTA